MDWSNFFVVHKDLPREGPGTRDDVAWACKLAGLAPSARICDAGSGPGGDIPALLEAVPEGRITAIDKHFGNVVSSVYADDTRVFGSTDDMADIGKLPDAPFDMVWCAGALYFLGLERGLETMTHALAPSGVLAFSEPCAFVDTPSDRARAFFEGYPLLRPQNVADKVAEAGFTVLGQRPVSDEGWEAYYRPMEARLALLRPDADAELTEMLDECSKEASDWRAVKDEIGYVLTVARTA